MTPVKTSRVGVGGGLKLVLHILLIKSSLARDQSGGQVVSVLVFYSENPSSNRLKFYFSKNA